MPLSASELSLTEVKDRLPPLRRLDPGLMPLPDTACGLEWSSLVSAAKAYEGERERQRERDREGKGGVEREGWGMNNEGGRDCVCVCAMSY